MCFHQDGGNIASNYLDRQLLDRPDRPSERLFRWHFRQAVLANMRGNGGVGERV